MKKLTLTLTAIAVGLLFSSQVFAWGPGRGHGEGRDCGYRGEAGFEKLNLTPEQKTKIEALQDANDKALRPLREKMFDKSVELRREWLKANPDKNMITAAQKEMRTLRDSIEDKDTALKLEIRKVLTPEQNEKIANSHWGRGHGFGPRGGMRGHGEHGQEMGKCQ